MDWAGASGIGGMKTYTIHSIHAFILLLVRYTYYTNDDNQKNILKFYRNGRLWRMVLFNSADNQILVYGRNSDPIARTVWIIQSIFDAA
jgi:hypothetical protein